MTPLVGMHVAIGTKKTLKKKRHIGSWMVVEPTHLKNMIVKLEILPNFRGEHKKRLKPPPIGSIPKLSGKLRSQFPRLRFDANSQNAFAAPWPLQEAKSGWLGGSSVGTRELGKTVRKKRCKGNKRFAVAGFFWVVQGWVVFFLRVKQFGNNVCVGNSFGEMSFSSRGCLKVRVFLLVLGCLFF